ncbi:MAG: glycosyltransferase family 39 protein [Candidatus Eiseniibacteriota bacterium]|nr:MAG: glycosyltransferase family 39 protein [Candidatus Eisenbacteria bacterium]
MKLRDSATELPFETSKRTGTILSVIVLLVGVLYRLYGLTGDITFDSAVYAQNAYNLLNGTFRLDTYSWYDHRLTVFVPVAASYALLGVGALSTHLWPLILSVSQIGAVLWLGSRWLGREIALLAAFFLALLPLDVKYAGVLSPDIVIAALLTLSAVCWIGAFQREERPPSGTLLFLGGLFLGLSILTRPYAAVMLPFFVVYAAWKRSFLRASLWWCLGVVSVGVPVVLLYAFLTGDPLFRLHAISSFYGAPPVPEGPRWLAYPALIWNLGNATGLFAPLFAATALLALVRPTRERLVLLLWIAPMLLYLQFGSMSLDSYVPVFKRVRFLTPLLAPGALLAATVVVEELPRTVKGIGSWLKFSPSERVSRILLALLILVLCLSSLVFMRGHRNTHVPVARSFRSVVEILGRQEELPILTDHWRTAIRLSYYMGFREGSHFYVGADESKRMERTEALKNSRLGYLKWYEDAQEVPEAFVVLEDEILALAEKAAVSDPSRSTYPAKDIPAYCHNPPDSWQLVRRSGSLRVFRSNGAGLR